MRRGSPYRRIVIAGIALVIAAAAFADDESTLQDPAEAFIAANQAYDQGDYGRAVELYREVMAAGVEDGRVLYNLGNAYLRKGELGEAVVAYRRALVLRPRDQDIRANQSFARSAAKDAIEPPKPGPVVSILLFWFYTLSPKELVLVVLTANLLFWTLAIGRIFRPQSEALKWTSLFCLAILIATGGSLLARPWLSPPIAVVLPQEIEAHTAPTLDSVVRFKLHAGTELRVRDRREDWIRVQLPDGQQGWVEAESLGLVER